MDKNIDKFKEDDYTYKLGYNLLDNKIYPCIEVYKDGKSFSGGNLSFKIDGEEFYFYTYSSYYNNGYIDTMKEMFTRLKKYSKIPEEVEKRFEEIYLIYKLNDFKKL